jgi:TolA-binding protein
VKRPIKCGRKSSPSSAPEAPGGQYPEGDNYHTASTLAQETLSIWHVLSIPGAKRNQSRDYLLAISKYEEFLAKFPPPESGTVQYLMAECFYQQGSSRNAEAISA